MSSYVGGMCAQLIYIPHLLVFLKRCYQQALAAAEEYIKKMISDNITQIMQVNIYKLYNIYRKYCNVYYTVLSSQNLCMYVHVVYIYIQ